MKRVVLDASLDSAAAVYARIARDLGLGPAFGRNLDALWDSLRADVAGPVEIVWRDSRAARGRLGKDYDRIAQVLREVAAARADVTFRAE